MTRTLILENKRCYNCGRTIVGTIPASIEEDDEKTYAVFLDCYGDLYCNHCNSDTTFSSEFEGGYEWTFPVNPVNPDRKDGLYYKFVRYNEETCQYCSEYGNLQEWIVGKKETVEGNPDLCAHGFHASPSPIGAHGNVSTDWCFLVKLEGKYIKDDSKLAALECTPIKLVHVSDHFVRSVVKSLVATLPENLTGHSRGMIERYATTDDLSFYFLRNIRSTLLEEHCSWFDGIVEEAFTNADDYDVNGPEECKRRVKARLNSSIVEMSSIAQNIKYYTDMLIEYQQTMVRLQTTFAEVQEDIERLF